MARATPPSKYPPYSIESRELESIIDSKLSVLAPHSLNYGIVCIYKVPEKHRNKNPEAYTPRLVSIGPLHYGQSQLQRMEEYKLKYLNNFLHAFRVPLGSLTEFVHAQEKLVHGCYENNYVRNLKKSGKDVKLSEVMLLDGVFILELFLKTYFRFSREAGDVIFENSWVSKDVLHDLLLLENQLPLKYLSSLYDSFIQGNLGMFLESDALSAPNFFDLVKNYFGDVGNTKNQKLTPKSHSAQHLVEFLSILHMDPEVKPNRPSTISEQKPHGKDGRKHKRRRKRGDKSELTYCPTVKELSTAGVKFERGVEEYLFAVTFNKETGELRIPPMVINDSTEPFLRNLIAFEQTGYHIKYITSYVILLDNFIDTGKDVEKLIGHKIIDNQLGTNDQVAEVINNLYKEVVTDPKEFHFLETCSELNEYRKGWKHRIFSKWAIEKANLKQVYFNTPWSYFSFGGVVLVILLTIMQAIVGVLSLLHDIEKIWKK